MLPRQFVAGALHYARELRFFLLELLLHIIGLGSDGAVDLSDLVATKILERFFELVDVLPERG